MGGCLPHSAKGKYNIVNQAAFYVKRKTRFAIEDGTVRLITKKGLKYKHNRFVNEKRPSLQSITTEDQPNLCKFYCCYNKMMAFFDQHDIDNAYKIANHILQKYSQRLDQLDPQFQSKEYRNVKRIVREYNQIQDFYRQIDGNGWVFKSQKNGVKVSTKKKQTTVGVKTEAVLNIPFTRFLAAISEFDYLKDIMPTISKSAHHKNPERNIRVGYAIASVPFMTDRQSYFQGGGYQRFERKNCIFMFARTISDRPDLLEEFEYVPQLNPEFIQLVYKYFVIKYQPIALNKGKITMALDIDMKISGIPLFIMDIGVQIFGNQIFDSIIKMGKHYQGSKWEDKEKENPKYYQWVAREIEQYLLDHRNPTEIVFCDQAQIQCQNPTKQNRKKASSSTKQDRKISH